MPKSTVGLINNSKNKLNSKIILIFNPYPNTHYNWVWIQMKSSSFCVYTSFFFFFFFEPWFLTFLSVHYSHQQNKRWTMYTFKNYLLQCIQFSIFSKISCIQTNPMCEHGYETRTEQYGPNGKTSNHSFLRFF